MHVERAVSDAYRAHHPDRATDCERKEAGLVRLIAILIVLAIAGVPLVAYLWETLNGLLAGHVDAQRLLVSIPVLLLFVVLLGIMARVLGRLGEASTPSDHGR